MPKRIEIDLSGIESLISKDFLESYYNQDRYLVEIGGGGSGKSHTVAQKLIIRAVTEENHRIFMVRKVKETVKQSQFTLIKEIITDWGLLDYFIFYEKDGKIKCKLNGSTFLPFGMDDSEKIKSVVSPTIVWYEEASELSPRDYIQMELRFRGETKYYKQSILTFNPISELIWVKKQFFPPDVELLLRKQKRVTYLYKEVVNKKGVAIKLMCHVHHSTYLDNDFIDDEYLATLFSIADADPAYGEIYLKGQWGRIDNLVYPDGFIMTENYPTEFEEVIYGLDFGNVHPTALIAAGKKDGEYYLWEVIYEPLKKKMKTNFGLIERMQEAQIDYGAHIYADIQGGQYIDEIKEKGFYNIKGAAKGKGSVSSGIDVVKRCKIHTKPENININKELLSYKHKENSEGKPIEGEYVNLYNDALDAIRYMITEDTMKEVDLNIWFGTAKV